MENPHITVSPFDARTSLMENAELLKQIEYLEKKLVKYSKTLDSVNQNYETSVFENQRLRSTLDVNEIKFDSETMTACPTPLRDFVNNLSLQNEKLKEVLAVESIEVEGKELENRISRKHSLINNAIKQIKRLKKLARLPVLDLWDAVERGSIVYAKLFIRDNQSIVFAFKNGSTALHRSIELGDVEMVNFLMNKGADPLILTENGTTSIMLAARSGNLNLFNIIFDLSDKKLINTVRQDGMTALHCAVSGGNISIVKKLLEHEFKLNAATSAGITPIMCMEEYNPALFDLLIERGANYKVKSKTDKTLIHVACRTGSLEFFQRVASMNIPLDTVTSDGCNVLHLATVSGNQALIHILLNHIPINSKTLLGYTPFLIAIQAEDIDVAQFLLTQGANMYDTLSDGKTALHIAVLTCNVDVCRFLLEKDFPINSRDLENNTPIMLAYDQRNLTVIEYLVSKGAILKDIVEESSKPASSIKTPIFTNPQDILKQLRDINQKLAEKTSDLEEKVAEAEAQHPPIIYASAVIQTMDIPVVHNVLANQIDMITVAQDKNFKSRHEAGIELLNELKKDLQQAEEENRAMRSENTQIKNYLEERDQDISKSILKKFDQEAQIKTLAIKEAEGKPKILYVINVVGGLLILIIAGLLFYIFNS